jgi:multidrug efflux pump subunit AcrA (membrane-fusion protein)
MSNMKTHIWMGFLVFSLMLSACSKQETTLPVRKNLEDAVFASGHIEQENNYTVSAKVDGILLAFPYKEGDSVSAGDVIARIESEVQSNQLQDALTVYQDAVRSASPDSPTLQHIQTQIDQAQKQLAFDQENYDRYKELWDKKTVAEVDFKKIELQYQGSRSNLLALQKQYEDVQNDLKLSVERSKVQLNSQQALLADYALTTEASGQVIQVFKKQGELARRGEAIARIGSGDYLIKLFVAEDDITKVDVGDPIAVQINTYPDERFMAHITKIYPAFDEAKQSYIVEARFDQLPEKMFSGTQLQANIETEKRENVLVIPTDYLSRGNFVLMENGEERQIVTGSQSREWTEVVSGISEQDVIVNPNP